MADVINVANYILEISRQESLDDEYDLITHMKLQKLVYFCQGHFMALCGKPLFNDPIQAWEHGPVCPTLYNVFKPYGPLPLTFSMTPQMITLDENEKRIISMVYDSYKAYSTSGLRNLTHKEGPWKTTPRNAVITPDAMLGYFDSLIEVKLEDTLPWTDSEKIKVVEILERAEASGEIDLSQFSIPVGT